MRTNFHHGQELPWTMRTLEFGKGSERSHKFHWNVETNLKDQNLVLDPASSIGLCAFRSNDHYSGGRNLTHCLSYSLVVVS